MKDLFTEDFTITVEVKRHNGETWVRALIDGHEPVDEGTTAALVMRVLPGLQSFAWSHAAEAGTILFGDIEDDDGGEGEPP